MSRTNPSPGAASFHEIATLRIELKDSDPLIWRELEVPTSVTLKVLHDIIQAAMGWFDHHLWEFTLEDRRYGLPSDEDRATAPLHDATKIRLRDILKPSRTQIDYLYDFGDNWLHRLIVTRVRQGDPDLEYPRYLSGERNAPPEDCGGIPGFYDMLAVLAAPDHPDYAEIAEWIEDYDPATIDQLPMQYALSRIARRRNAAATRFKSKKTAENS